jgi:hypothetical protein
LITDHRVATHRRRPGSAFRRRYGGGHAAPHGNARDQTMWLHGSGGLRWILPNPVTPRSIGAFQETGVHIRQNAPTDPGPLTHSDYWPSPAGRDRPVAPRDLVQLGVEGAHETGQSRQHELARDAVVPWCAVHLIRTNPPNQPIGLGMTQNDYFRSSFGSSAARRHDCDPQLSDTEVDVGRQTWTVTPRWSFEMGSGGSGSGAEVCSPRSSAARSRQSKRRKPSQQATTGRSLATRSCIAPPSSSRGAERRLREAGQGTGQPWHVSPVPVSRTTRRYESPASR